jgi:hypothetical protein
VCIRPYSLQTTGSTIVGPVSERSTSERIDVVVEEASAGGVETLPRFLAPVASGYGERGDACRTALAG